MSRLLRLGLAAAAAALSLPLTGVGTGAAAAASSSTAGACTTDEGVTVVVDLSAFGGSIVVRCVPGPLASTYTGWDALSDAGFHPQAPTREPGFVCRVGGEPAASRSMDIPENPDYHEQCVNTPPQSAYWGYWYATNGGSWTYSTSGAASHAVIEGGYEGWAFALNSNGNPPKPGVAPSHPVTKPTQPPGGSGGHHGSGGAPTTGPTSTPTTSGTASPTTDPTTTGSGDHHGRQAHHRADKPGHAIPGPKTSAAAEPPSAAASTQAEVTGELPASPADSGSGSAVPTLLGAGLLVILGAGAGVTAWRRSHRS